MFGNILLQGEEGVVGFLLHVSVDFIVRAVLV